MFVWCIIILVRNKKTKHQTKMARNLYEQLRQQAKEVEDKENSKLYVSETVTKKNKRKS